MRELNMDAVAVAVAVAVAALPQVTASELFRSFSREGISDQVWQLVQRIYSANLISGSVVGRSGCKKGPLLRHLCDGRSVFFAASVIVAGAWA